MQELATEVKESGLFPINRVTSRILENFNAQGERLERIEELKRRKLFERITKKILRKKKLFRPGTLGNDNHWSNFIRRKNFT